MLVNRTVHIAHSLSGNPYTSSLASGFIFYPRPFLSPFSTTVPRPFSLLVYVIPPLLATAIDSYVTTLRLGVLLYLWSSEHHKVGSEKDFELNVGLGKANRMIYW